MKQRVPFLKRHESVQECRIIFLPGQVISYQASQVIHIHECEASKEVQIKQLVDLGFVAKDAPERHTKTGLSSVQDIVREKGLHRVFQNFLRLAPRG